VIAPVTKYTTLVSECPRGVRNAETLVNTDSTEAVRKFVQGFYDWYVPIAISDTVHFPAWYYVLTNAHRYLDPDLAAALRADSVAQQDDPTKQTRDVLDFDPFLLSQDPCGPYEVIAVRRHGDTFRVPIRPCRAKGAGPVVEVRDVNGRWRISNVLGLDGDRSLRSYLCEWAKADLRKDRRPAKC
jgi:hypothetical protein